MKVQISVVPGFPTASGLPLVSTHLSLQGVHFLPMAVCANALVPESSGISGGFSFPTICIVSQVPSVSSGFSMLHRAPPRFLHYTGVSE